MKSNIAYPMLVCIMLVTTAVHAQFPYHESFKNSTVSGLVVSGAAKLTATSGIDPEGQGYLRLTENVSNSIGYVYAEDSFPSTYGLTASFEFFTYKSGANGSNQADGISFFLFDASINSFRPGGFGGSLGYAQKNVTPGVTKGYIGIGIDEFGNFSNALDGDKIGGIGQKKGSITVRGPGNGRSSSDYVYVTSVKADSSLFNAGFTNFNQRYPDSTTANYRRIKIVLKPGSSQGAGIGYTVTVIMVKGGTPTIPVTLIDHYDYPYPAPSKLQFGLAGSTGSITDFHEIRNMNIDVTNSAALLAPLTVNDVASTCQGQDAIADVTANDLSRNTGGSIDKTSVDLNIALPGQQTTYVDAGKGSYTVNDLGIVTFTPATGFTGNAVLHYTVNDIYGSTADGTATLTVSVSGGSAPTLTVVNPTPACFPAVIDLTNSSWRTNTSPGASFDYFSSLTNANNNTSNINATANAITVPGQYYIRTSLNGCATIRPISVQIDQPPSVANAGTDQTACTSTGGLSFSLNANNPDVGIGTWTPVNGPSVVSAINEHASISPTTNLQKGIYNFRWTIANGACASSSDEVRITVGVPSVAGNNQALANANTATLQGNDPAPGVGTWSLVSGPALSITNPTSATSTVTGLVPGSTYVLKWTVVNGTCNTSSQVTITNSLNTVADAGPDRSVTAVNSISLTGNAPDAGNTGLWSIVSAPSGSTPVITQPANRSTTVTGLNRVGDYLFRWTISNGGFSTTDDVKVSVLSVLPVTYINFTGTVEHGQATLRWQTSNEERNNVFVVERSEDGSRFITAATIPANTGSDAVKRYEYSEPAANNVYYRLRQVDRDGSFSFSPVIRLNALAAGIGVRSWPNPFREQLSVSLTVNTPQHARITVLDQAGRALHATTGELLTGTNSFTIPGISGLAPGMYVLRIAAGSTLYSCKVVKE